MPSPAQARRDVIDAKVRQFHDASDQVYGAPRILADLREDGVAISRKTVAASMRRQQLAGISPRTFTPVTTVIDLDAHRPTDLVERRFDRGELDKVWTSDITYLSTDEGWLYLCAVRDGCSRRVLGWAVEDHMRTDLVESALSMAVTMRGALPGQVIFHADGVSTPPGSSPDSPVATTWPNQSGGRGCVGTTPRPNPSGAHSNRSSTADTPGRPRLLLGSRSATGSNGSTTADDGIRNSA